MKQEVKTELKQRGRYNIFTETRYKLVSDLMKIARAKDKLLKEYLDISPDFKVNFIVDHMIKFVDLGKI